MKDPLTQMASKIEKVTDASPFVPDESLVKLDGNNIVHYGPPKATTITFQTLYTQV